MLTAQEQAELDALEAEFAPKKQTISRSMAAPSRNPTDLTNPKMQFLSPEEEDELAALENEFAQRPAPGPVESKGLLTQVGEAVDSYAAAPVRRMVGEFQDTGSLRQSANAFVNQFGADPGQAPTGKEIAEKAGFSTESLGSIPGSLQISEEQKARQAKLGGNYGPQPQGIELPSPAGIAGLGADVALDITNLIPFVGVGLKSAGKGTKWALKGSAKAADAALGTPLVKVGDVLSSTGKASAKSLRDIKVSMSKLFKPDFASDYNELAEIAARNGIDKNLINESIEYGKNSTISRYARGNAEGLGGDALEKHELLLQKVSDVTEEKLLKIGKTTTIADDVEAGAIIRESFDEGVDTFFKGIGETYGNAIKANPGMRMPSESIKSLSSKLNEMEMWANRKLQNTKHLDPVINDLSIKARPLKKAIGEFTDILDSTNEAITQGQKSQAREVLNAVRIVKNAMNRTGGDLGQVYSAMRDIGDIAFKTKNSLAEVPSDIRKFQELYFSLQKAGTETIRAGMGDEFAESLIENNKAMSSFFSNRSKINGVIGNKSLGEAQVFKSIIQNGDPAKIDALFSIISPESASKLKATYLNNLIVRKDGIINFSATRSALEKLQKTGKLKTIFKNDELLELDEILRLGDRAGVGVLSALGTGGAAKLADLVGTVKAKLANDALVENFKNMARSNYVEIPTKAPNGVEYVKLLKGAKKEASKSGLSRLREATPVSKTQAAQGLKINSIDERNKKLSAIKRLKGMQ